MQSAIRPRTVEGEVIPAGSTIVAIPVPQMLHEPLPAPRPPRRRSVWAFVLPIALALIVSTVAGVLTFIGTQSHG